MFKSRSAMISAAVAIALAMTPLSQASARGYRGGGVFLGLAAVGAVALAATILTAPIAIATAPFRGPAYYPPPAPAYYPPPAPYYAQPPAYAYPPGYYQPR
jgi:hypothetical protein